MKRQHNLPQKLTTMVFAGLLIGTALLSKPDLFRKRQDLARQKELSLRKNGFYLDPVNAQAGIDFRHRCAEVDHRVENIAPQIAMMGGASVAVVDFDRDGWDDLYFTNSAFGSQNALYRNLHNGKFENVAAEMGVADVNKKGMGASMGSVWADYDNDGYEDLLIYKWGRPQLFHNEGGKKFVDVTQGSGLPDWVNAYSAIWLDFNNDGLPDLFIGGYFSEKLRLDSLNTTRIMPQSFRYANNGGRNYLLENMGNGKFKDVTAAYGLTSTKWTLAAASADFNGDGYPDLFIANDYNVNELYMNRGGKEFIEAGRQSGIGNIPKSGMCVSFGDMNNTGILGIYNTTITEKGILIQDNNYWQPETQDASGPYPHFVNMAQLAGIDNAGWSYGAQFGDLNNDGAMDLYVANGFISARKNTSYWYDYSKVTGGNASIIEDASNWPDMHGKSQSGYEQDKIWMNRGDGSFEDISNEACPYAAYDGRSVAMADLWNNGAVDVIVANENTIPLVYRNEQNNGNHWIEYDLQGTVHTADAIGARVTVEWAGKKQVQVVTAGIGFSSQNQHRLHFGLGKNVQVDRVTIIWPGGGQTLITHPAVDKLYTVREETGKH